MNATTGEVAKMAKVYIDSLDGITSDDIKSIATKDESTGRFVIDVVPATFRDHNIELKKQLEGLQPKLSNYITLFGEDPEVINGELKQLRDVKKRVENKDLVENSSFEDALKQRTVEMRQSHDAAQKMAADAIKEKETELQRLQRSLDEQTLSTQLQLAVYSEKSGIRPEAFPDILTRAAGVFHVEGSKLIAKDERGEPIYGEDANPLTVPGWLKRLTDDVPYYLKGTTGGGAGGGRGGAGAKFTQNDMAGMDQKTYERVRRDGK